MREIRYEDDGEAPDAQLIARKTENLLKKVMVAGLKSNKPLLLCRALKSISMYVSKTHCQDKGFIRIAIDVFCIISLGYQRIIKSFQPVGSS